MIGKTRIGVGKKKDDTISQYVASLLSGLLVEFFSNVAILHEPHTP
jgi:hypothetical protein